jgi:predicted GIY-YIG superfamily endonuclease
MKKYVYKLINSKDKIEYIGETMHPNARFRVHKSKKFRGRNDIKMVIVAEFDNRKDAYNYQCDLQKQYGLISDKEIMSYVQKCANKKGASEAGGKKVAEKYSNPVLVYDYKTNKFISEFSSQRQCAIKLKLNEGNVASCIKGKYKQTGGYKIILK